MQSISRFAAGFGAVALIVGGVIAGGQAEPAAAVPAGNLTWSTASVKAEYGQYWMAEISYTADPQNWRFGSDCYINGCPASAHLDGPRDVDFDFLFQPTSWRETTATATISPFWNSGQVPVVASGSYTLTVTFAAPSGDVPAVSPPLDVSIVPAALTFTLTTQADPAAPAALIASVLLTRQTDDVYIGIEPGGTWTLRGTTENGDEVLSRELTLGTDGYRVWANTYWADPPPGEKVTLTLTASGTSADYSVTDASTTLTTLGAPTPLPTPEPTAAPDDVASASSAAVPTWSLLVAGLIVLAAIVIIVIVLLRRRPRALPDDADAPDPDAASDADSATVTQEGVVR